MLRNVVNGPVPTVQTYAYPMQDELKLREKITQNVLCSRLDGGITTVGEVPGWLVIFNSYLANTLDPMQMDFIFGEGNFRLSEWYTFKTQLGPPAKNATLRPPTGNQICDLENLLHCPAK